jgi:hypothetical protein
MDAITLDEILRAEHNTLQTAFTGWIAVGEHPSKELYWAMGVNEFASTLIEMLNRGESDGE